MGRPLSKWTMALPSMEICQPKIFRPLTELALQTRDGHVVVWHDESVLARKCRDTSPVVENDPMFPYVEL